MPKSSQAETRSGSSWLSQNTYQNAAREVREWPQWKRDAYGSIGGSSRYSQAPSGTTKK